MNDHGLLKISVIIPTCHRNDLLAKCLNCLAPGVQTLSPEQYEVIVTDDGSRSTAEQLVRDKYPWARWVEGPRRGPAANRNRGAATSHGDWLAFTDDDCLPSREWLSALTMAIIPCVEIYEGKTTCEAGVRSPMEQAPINLHGGWLWSCNMMVHNDVFQNLGGFDERFPHPHMEDTDLRERIKFAMHPFLFVESAVIDHPPRRVPSGKKLSAYHESEIMFWCRQKKSRPFLMLFRGLVKARIKNIISHRVSRDSVCAGLSLIVELLYTLCRLPEWKKKYF